MTTLARQTGAEAEAEAKEVSGRVEVAKMSDPGFIFGFLLGALHWAPSMYARD